MTDLKTLPHKVCNICGGDYRECYIDGPELRRMIRDGLCFTCALWELRAEAGCHTVIDHCVYTPGRATTGEFRGCGGRRFDIEYLADGRRITTFDLWGGGVIPERLRGRIPDTAKFLNGAERTQVGDIGCFNGSDGKTPPYPLPSVEDSK